MSSKCINKTLTFFGLCIIAKLFFSYSHKDEKLRNELETHLALLKRQGVISSWYDRRITAGSNFGQLISAELESAQIILLLVSAHFLDSDYCYEKEMRRAIEKNKDGSAILKLPRPLGLEFQEHVLDYGIQDDQISSLKEV